MSLSIVARKSTAYINVKRHRPGEPGHTQDTHGTHGRTRGHLGGHTDHTDEPSQPTNAPTRTTARRPKPRPTQQPKPRLYVGIPTCKPPCWCRKFRCTDKHAGAKDCAQGDASERCIWRSSRTKTRQRRSWPCTACAPPQESVSQNSKIKFEQSSACQSPSNSRLS